jgi:hypothetical protein
MIALVNLNLLLLPIDAVSNAVLGLIPENTALLRRPLSQADEVPREQALGRWEPGQVQHVAPGAPGHETVPRRVWVVREVLLLGVSVGESLCGKELFLECPNRVLLPDPLKKLLVMFEFTIVVRVPFAEADKARRRASKPENEKNKGSLFC